MVDRQVLAVFFLAHKYWGAHGKYLVGDISLFSKCEREVEKVGICDVGGMGGVGFGWEAVWGKGNVLKSSPFLVFCHSIIFNLPTQRFS